MPVIRPTIKTYDELQHAVEGNQDVLTIRMIELRNIHGVQRLGIHVNSDISRELRGRGLGHRPEKLPKHQHAYVRIFKFGSAADSIIEAVHKVSPSKDKTIRAAALAAHRTNDASGKSLRGL